MEVATQLPTKESAISRRLPFSEQPDLPKKSRENEGIHRSKEGSESLQSGARSSRARGNGWTP